MKSALSDRERQILARLSFGLEASEIGSDLWLTTNTVKTHLGRIYKKLGANNGVHAVAIALRTGLIS